MLVFWFFSFLLLLHSKSPKTYLFVCSFVFSNNNAWQQKCLREKKKRKKKFIPVNGKISRCSDCDSWVGSSTHFFMRRLSCASSPIHNCKDHLFSHWLLNITSVAIPGNHTNCLHGKVILGKY